MTTCCPSCGEPMRYDEAVEGPIGYRCKLCDERATESDRRDKVMRYIRDLVSAQVDSSLYARETVPSLSDVLISAYDEFGGPTQLGVQWARVIKTMIDECLTTGARADKAHKAILDFAKMAHLHEEIEHPGNYEDMTPEELEEQRKTALLHMFADMLKRDTSDKLLEAARVLADAECQPG